MYARKPVAQIIHNLLYRTTTYSVTYDTSAEYVVTVAAGAAIAASYIATQAALCPNQRFVLSGYSKGALVVHSEYCSRSSRFYKARLFMYVKV